jgi:hypothetical protein
MGLGDLAEPRARRRAPHQPAGPVWGSLACPGTNRPQHKARLPGLAGGLLGWFWLDAVVGVGGAVEPLLGQRVG